MKKFKRKKMVEFPKDKELKKIITDGDTFLRKLEKWILKIIKR